MLSVLSIVIFVAVAAMALTAGFYLLRNWLLDDRLLAVAGVLELGLLVQLGVGLAQVAGTDRDIERALFVGYLFGVIVVPPAAAFLALKEKSRWGMGVLIVGALVVTVLMARLQQVWNGVGV